MKYNDVFSYIKGEELAFAQDHEVTDNWWWNFKKHINWTILFKHGKFPLSQNNYTIPAKNIVLPLLELRYRAEDIDLKEVVLYVDDQFKYHLSFLAKKYHEEVYAIEHKLETFFDETKEEKIDFGGVIVREGKDGPVWENLETLAFCDRSDFLKGPICFKTEYTPEELYEKQKSGWGKIGADTTIDELIDLFESSNASLKNQGKQAKDKVEVYRLHGSLPGEWLGDYKEKYIRQLCVVAFYQNAKGTATGVTLYKAREYKNPFKVHLDGKKLKNRCLAFGGVERLFDPQVWTNFSERVKHQFLQAASKIILWTDDEAFANGNDIKSQDNLTLNYINQGRQIGQIPTTPVNMRLFDGWIAEMQEHAERLSQATGPLLGESAPSGTPFRAQERQVLEGRETHNYRKEKFSDFIKEIYEDIILPDIQKELVKGKKFLATLNLEELEYVADAMAKNQAANILKEKVLNGENILEGEKEAEIEKARERIKGIGVSQFLDILKGEFEAIPLKVKVTVGNRGKDLMAITDKLSSVFQLILQNPAILDDPRASKVFSNIIQFSGLDPIMFGVNKAVPRPVQPAQSAQIAQPVQPSKELAMV